MLQTAILQRVQECLQLLPLQQQRDVRRNLQQLKE